MPIGGCLLALFLGAIFLVVYIVANVAAYVFGVHRNFRRLTERMRPRSKQRSDEADYTEMKNGERPDTSTARTTSRFFSKTDGEYIDFEEIKSDGE